MRPLSNIMTNNATIKASVMLPLMIATLVDVLYTLKRRREGKDLNRRKNDYRDSEVAAQLLFTGEFTESRVPQGVFAELRTAHNAGLVRISHQHGL